jgi:hypothetical protein
MAHGGSSLGLSLGISLPNLGSPSPDRAISEAKRATIAMRMVLLAGFSPTSKRFSSDACGYEATVLTMVDASHAADIFDFSPTR